MFRTVPLSIIRSFSLCTQQWCMTYGLDYSLRAGSGRNCSSVLILLASCQQTCVTCTIAVCTVQNLQFRPDPAHKLSANLYDIYHCCVHSEKPLMMDRVTVRNM